MKYIFFVVVLVVLSCKEHVINPQKSTVTKTETQRKLKKTALPIEVIASNVTHIPKLIKADGIVQLRYELNISNNYRIPFTLARVQIFNLENDSIPIAQYDSDYIIKNFDRPGFTNDNNISFLDGNQYGVLNLNVSFDNEQPIPKKIYHKLFFEHENKKGEINSHPMEVAVIAVPAITKITLGFPFHKKGKWFYEAIGHQGARFLTEGNVSYPQRFAMDYTFVDDEGRFTKGDVLQNENWNVYGIELIAVADGTVVAIKDGIKENIPLSEDTAVKITSETIGGNYVILDIGNETHAFYGHLIPNSLKVNVGDSVTKGQVIGLLGNSGNSDAPHLHFHLEFKNKNFFGGEGMAYVLDNFTQLDTYNDDDITLFINTLQVALDSLNRIKKQGELPVGIGLIEID